MITNRGMGWIKDRRDGKDFMFAAPAGQTLPRKVDHRKTPFMPPIVDQLQTESCVGNSSASVYRFMMRRYGLPDFQPSRLFTYYLARAMEDSADDDAGCMPRDAMQSLISNGTCDETLWPFDVDRVNVRPPQDLLHEAKAHHVIEGKYTRMLATDDLYHLKHSLVNLFPFTIGIPVYTSFMDVGADGIVPMPKHGDKLEGYHLMYTVGYDDDAQLFINPNSWSEEDGDHGVRYLPYAFVERYGDDLWRFEAVT